MTMLERVHMKVTEAVLRRSSIRAFRPDPVPAEVVRDILECAKHAPSGGNLQPWVVYALTGNRLDEFKSLVGRRLTESPQRQEVEYDIYPPKLWDPFRRRRAECGEDMFGTIGIGREDRAARLGQVAKNYAFFGAPVGLFFCLERKLGPPQWADMGMFMQTVMLLAVERGLDTCPQEAWAQWARTIAEFVGLPDDHMVFAGMALGFRDDTAPINTLRTRREPLDGFAKLLGF
jgi:nitroreductase